MAALASGAPANAHASSRRGRTIARLLASAGCSVSLCGYNTAVELARCTTPALLVPSEEAGEREQLIRARRLAGYPGFELMRMDELTAERPGRRRPRRWRPGRARPPVPLAGDDGSRAIETLAAIVAAKAAAMTPAASTTSRG